MIDMQRRHSFFLRFALLCIGCSATLFIATATASPRYEHLEASPTGVHIQLSSIASLLQSPAQQLLSAPALEQGRIIPARKGEAPTIRYIISVPATGTIHARLNIQRLLPLSAQSTIKVNAATTWQPGVRVRRLGIQRNIWLAEVEVQTIQAGGVYARASIIDSVQIDIVFEKALQKALPGEITSPLVCNAYRDASADDTPAPLLQQITPWYDPAKTYLRVSTTRDGIAYISGSDIIAQRPDLLGARSRYLHLLYNGVEQALYAPLDSDGFIDKNDQFYYVGRRAAGDTTWFSPFSREAVFYLYYEENNDGKRFSTASFNANNQELSVVDIQRHIEVELEYRQAISTDHDFDYFHNTETVQGERWIWKNVTRANDFRYTELLTPTANPADSIELRLHYSSINDYVPSNPDHRLQFRLNELLIADETFEGAQDRIFAATITAANYGAGALNLIMTSVGTPDNEMTEQQDVDYIEIRGKEKAYARNGLYTCSAPTQNAANLKVTNLQSQLALMLDTLRNTAYTATGVQGTTVRLSVRNTAPFLVNLVLNDSVTTFIDRAALTLYALHAPNYTTQSTWYSTPDDESVSSYLNALPAQSLVFVLLNGDGNLSTAMKEYLKRHGQSSIITKQAKECAVAILMNGVSGSLQENVATSLASLAEFVPHTGGLSWQAKVPLQQGDNIPLIASKNTLERASLAAVPNSNVQNPTTQADYLLISHPDFKQQAERLAAYRRAQGWRSVVVSVEDIYKEFNGGQKSPHAIKEFLRYTLRSWAKPAPQYVVLFGDASWDPRQIPPLGVKRDFVPTYGKPVSDYWYTLLVGNDVLPDMTVGRIPCETAAQAEAAINKIIEYDTVKPQPWMKNFLLVTGGENLSEQQEFYDDAVLGVAPFLSQNLYLCGDTITAALLRSSQYGTSLSTHIVNSINAGVVWLNYVGHGAPSLTEIPGWDADVLSNKGRYPLLVTFSCQNGAFAERELSARNEEYMLIANKGSVASMGTTGYGTKIIDAMLNTNMFDVMWRLKLRRLGDIMQEAKLGLGHFDESPYYNTLLQYSLLGDPLSRLPIDTVVHPYVLPQEISVTNLAGGRFITEDSLMAELHFKLRNSGMYEKRAVPLIIVHEFNGKRDTLRRTLSDLCYTEELDGLLAVKDRAGVHTLYIIIDPNNTLGLGNIEQRTFVSEFTVYSRALLPVDPMAHWDVDAEHPRFRVINPMGSGSDIVYEASLLSQDSTEILHLDFGSSTNLTITETHVEWKPEISLQKGGTYLFRIRYKSLSENKPSPWLGIPFTAAATTEENTAVIQIRSTEDFRTFSSSGFRRLENDADTTRFILNYFLPASVLSAHGKAYYLNGNVVREINSAANIDIGASSYGYNMYKRGFTIVTMPRNDSAEEKREYRWIDVGGDSTSVRRWTYNFLKDSIKQHHYALIATCEGIYFREKLDSYFDSIRTALKTLGSQLSDSLVEPNAYSGIALREQNSSTMLAEAYRAYDSIKVTHPLRISPDVGSITSPVYGPAQQWYSMQLQGNLEPDVAEVRLKIYGRDKTGTVEEFIREEQSITPDLRSIDAQKYPYLRFVLEVQRKNYENDPSLRSWELRYQPWGEMAVIPSSLKIEPNNLLRGDTTYIQAAVQVISPRVPVPSTKSILQYIPLEGAGETRSISDSSHFLRYDMPWWLYDTVGTRNLANRSQVELLLNPGFVVAELYPFNNKTAGELHVQNDTIAPEIRILIDGVEAYERMQVATTPLFTILSDDNSRILLTDSSSLRAKLNAFTVTRRNATGYSLLLATDAQKAPDAQRSTRAVLSFSDTLDVGINNLSVVAYDAVGNKREKTISVMVSERVKLLSSLAYPNPAKASPSFRYVYEGQEQNVPVNLVISDVNGREINRLHSIARLGENTIAWNGLSLDGESISQGVYFYTLYLDSLGTEDAQHGMFVILP